MRISGLVAAAGVWFLLQAAAAVAQPTVSSVFPRSCLPGATTRVTLTGKGFSEPLRVTTPRDGATIDVVAITAEQVTLDVQLPVGQPLGPLGIWIATATGSADPIILLADDLPPRAEPSGNVSLQEAEVIVPMTVVEGSSKGPLSSFFKFDVAANQRIAVEVLTQAIESKMDPVVRLYDPEGRVLVVAGGDEVGPDCRFSYTFATAGTYGLEVHDNRYTGGLPYLLRIGDFPVLRHAFPPAVAAGKTTTVHFVGPDGEHALPQTVDGQYFAANTVTTVATTFAEGQASAWVPILVADAPVHQQVEDADKPTATAATPLMFPVTITGQLRQSGQPDRYPIQGVKGTMVRIAARERSLGCVTTLGMRLLDESGGQVAQAKVAETDEWSFQFAFPDDRVYQLEVSDLLGRGGAGFGYVVQVVPAGGFALELKPDAAVRQRFDVESGQGAVALDLQVQRFGYAGEIELELLDAPPGLRIVNPRVAGSANNARIYVMADNQWTNDAQRILRVQGRATEDAAVTADLDSIAWQRLKTPHAPFPIHWRNGTLVCSGVAAGDPWFTLEPAEPIRLARPVPQHAATLHLKRIQEAFKGEVVVMGNPEANQGPLESTQQADVYQIKWTRADDAAVDPQSLPTQLSLLAYAEHQNRGRMVKIDIPLQWFDPASLVIQTASPDSDTRAGDVPLIAGGNAELTLQVVRRGDDPQPLTVTFPGADDVGFGTPPSLEIAADQTTVPLPIRLAAHLDVTEPIVLPYVIRSTYQGQTYQGEGQSQPLAVIAAPQSIEVFPPEVALAGNRDRQQLVVTGYDKQGTPRDWTRDARITVADPQIAEIRGTSVFAKADGQTHLVVQVGAQHAEIPLRVAGTAVGRAVAFENEVLVALSKQGCNSGACHGSPSGKGMFRLSLRAFDRQLDELTLIREDYGRRLNPIEPDQSLLLQKPLMKVSHGGGKQLKVDDEAYRILRDWIAQGAPTDPADAARCVRLEVKPARKRVLRLEAGTQQIAAIAHFSDGMQRDVTHLVAYESSDMSVATVDPHGLVTPHQRGETVILVRFLEHIEAVPLMFIQQIPGFAWKASEPANYVDELVYQKLQQLQFVPAPPCSDAEFLRRASLDLIGVLPAPEASAAFLADPSPDKRARLVEQLLQRDQFAKFWALKWGDLLKMTGKGVGDDGVYKYHRWVQEAFRNNLPYDQFAEELLTASGSTWANPAANFYRTATDMNECVENVSQVFLGARLQCAKCHNHPFERWTQDNYYGLGAFFHRVQRRKTQRPGEMFVWTAATGDVVQPRTGEKLKPWLPVRGSIDVDDAADRRQTFAQWLIEPSNPYFAKMEVNRIWAQLFARGIVDPIDDFRDSNPPSNEALLDALAADFVQAGFDRKHILKVIMNSHTYQASSQTTPLNQDDLQYFSHQRPRLLSAEQLLDAINHTTGLETKFGNLPPGTLATHLPAPDVVKVDFLKVFGQPERTTVCACERVDDSNLGMAIELFNGTTIHDKLRDPQTRFRSALAAGKSLNDVIQDLYLTALCRYPSEQELQVAAQHCEHAEDVAVGMEDVYWALINTDEFLFQH